MAPAWCVACLGRISEWLDPVLPKLVYLTLMLAGGLSAPYLGLFLSELRTMNKEFIGLAIGTLQLCSPLVAPLWGLVADYTERTRLLVASLALGGFTAR
jgi:MFS family permease